MLDEWRRTQALKATAKMKRIAFLIFQSEELRRYTMLVGSTGVNVVSIYPHFSVPLHGDASCTTDLIWVELNESYCAYFESSSHSKSTRQTSH